MIMTMPEVIGLQRVRLEVLEKAAAELRKENAVVTKCWKDAEAELSRMAAVLGDWPAAVAEFCEMREMAWGLAARLEVLEKEVVGLRGALRAQDNREQIAGEECGILWVEHGCDWPDAISHALIVARRNTWNLAFTVDLLNDLKVVREADLRAAQAEVVRTRGELWEMARRALEGDRLLEIIQQHNCLDLVQCDQCLRYFEEDDAEEWELKGIGQWQDWSVKCPECWAENLARLEADENNLAFRKREID